MPDSVPVRLGRRDLHAVVTESRGGRLLLRIDADEWSSIGLRKESRIEVQRGLAPAWYEVEAVMVSADPPEAWVTLIPAIAPATVRGWQKPEYGRAW